MFFGLPIEIVTLCFVLLMSRWCEDAMNVTGYRLHWSKLYNSSYLLSVKDYRKNDWVGHVYWSVVVDYCSNKWIFPPM